MKEVKRHNGACRAAAIAGTSILAPSYKVKYNVSVTHLKMGLLQIKSIGTQSSNELQWLDLKIGYQDESSNTHCQGMTYWSKWECLLFTHKRELLLADLSMPHIHSMQSKPSVIMNRTEWLQPIVSWEIWMQFKHYIFNHDLLIGILISPDDNALQWMPPDLTDGQSTLVQAKAWWHHATRC